MANLEYKIVEGNLGAVGQLTNAGYRLQTARELQNDRCKDGQESLQNTWFYVAGGNVFYLNPKNRKISWAHTNGEHNLIILPQYIDRASRELSPTGIFQPDTAQESWDAINHRSTKRFALDDLGLVKESDKVYFMPINTGKFDTLSPVKQRAASSVGHTRKNVAYLNKCGILETQIRFPNPEYVAAVLEECNNPFWRASWLLSFGNNSIFDAVDRNIDDGGLLRGVRSSSCERSEPSVECPQGDTLKNAVPSTNSRIVHLNPEIAADYLINAENRMKVLARLKREHTLGLHDLIGELLRKQ